MMLETIDCSFSVCKVPDFSLIDLAGKYCFASKTDEERSLVCATEAVPANATNVDDGWRAFRVQGVLDFSLVGVLAKISSLLAENKISLFAISTFNTDYILTREEDFGKALDVLSSAGYEITRR